MRRRVFAVALATTMLTPIAADAEPVSAFIAGYQSFFSSGFALSGAVGGAAGGAAGFAFTAGAGLASIGQTLVGRVVLSIGLSALVSGLTPQVSVPKPSARMVSFAEPVSYAKHVFGECRVSGPIGFTGAKSGRRYYVPILAAHPVDSVLQHWIDEYTCGVDAAITDVDTANILSSGESGAYTAPAVLGTTRKEAGRIDFFDGGAAQVAHPGLVDKFAEVTTEWDFAGLAGAVLWARRVGAERFSEVYPRGREWSYSAVLRGWNQIYDPRDGSTGYTNNAALVIAHWAVAVLGHAVDWDAVAIEADASDIPTLDADGISRPKWTINGELTDDQSFETQRAQLAAACDAFFFERPDGSVGFNVGRWIEPRVTLVESDFLTRTMIEGQWGANAPTEVAATYTEPDNGWRETASGAWVETDDIRQNREEPQLFMVTNHNQAARLNKRIAKARRPRFQLQATLGLIGEELIGERFFRVAHPVFGDLDFEVGRLVRRDMNTFEVEAVSTDASHFDFDAATEEPERPAIIAVESDLSLPDPTGLAAAASTGSSGTVVWDAHPDYIWPQVRWRAIGDDDWQSATVTEEDQNALVITGLTDGQEYEVQVRNTLAGLQSSPTEWFPETPMTFTAVANNTPPTALDSLSLTLSGSDITVGFTAPNDPNYFGTRIWCAATDTYADATLVRTEYGIPSSGDSWTDTGLAPGTYYYWAAPINASGLEGPLTGPVSETVT